MNTRIRLRTGLALSLPVMILLVLTNLLGACTADRNPATPEAGAPAAVESQVAGAPPADAKGAFATGEVQLVWRGNAGNTAHGDSIRIAVADFAAHAASRQQPAYGSFTYRVESLDGTPHRIVTATVDGVVVDTAARRVWFTGVVTADTKGCGGGPSGGHADGCGDDGGCTDGHDDGHDGGCTDGDHDDSGCTDGTHDDGGGTDGSHDDGGCPDGTHEDGGCPTGSHDTGGAGGPRGATGRSCRIGQVIAGKAHDSGTPAPGVDGITWKWFLADDPSRPDIGDVASWPHLCRKTITGGNLVLHLPGVGTDARPGALQP